MITVQLLGGACLRSGEVPLDGPPAQRHRIALLTLVVAAWPQPLSRDRAMALLWPERESVNARRLLNLAVHVLRSTLGEAAIVSTGDGLLFDPSLVRCDLQALREAIVEHDDERIVRLYAGPLLDGFHLDESTEFGFWLEERRADLHHAHVAALRAVAGRREDDGDLLGAIAACRRLVAADPHSATSAMALMRLLDAAGDRAGAIQHANEYVRRLREELELAPEPEVLALADRLRAGPGHRQGATAAHPPAPVVAVLPFVNLGPDPDGDCFAEGMTEDVIAALAKIRALAVIARSSVMAFKERTRSLQAIARTLGASAAVDGTVRRAGDRVRIVATLIEPRSGRQLWAETYDRELTDIFAIQSDVALHIATALEAELSPDERSRVQREPTHDLLAYELLLRGRRESHGRSTPDTIALGIEHFDRAIARDPSFALAHANRSIGFTELVEFGAIDPGVGSAKARAAADDALRLDPELGPAYCAMGFLKAVCEFDWEGSERAFRRAIELGPSDADSYDLYGRLLAGLERYDESLVLLTRARDLDPLVHRLDFVTTLLRAGRYDEAIPAAEHAVMVEPSARALATLGWAYFFAGRRELGLTYLERATAVGQDTSLWLAQLGEACGLAGNVERARAILRALEERAWRSFVSPYHLAYVHTGLGNADRAVELLESAVERRSGAVYAIKGSFLFTPLRAHPRFHALLRRMRLE